MPMQDMLNMDNILAFLDSAPDEAWCVDWCGMKQDDGSIQFCVRGHLLVYGEAHGHRGFDDVFHEFWATEYMYYPVNDGKNPAYQQATPKARVMAYFRDLSDGKQKTTPVLWEEAKEQDIRSMAELMGVPQAIREQMGE